MTPHDDRFDLGRFTDAQDRVYPQVVDELRHGRKRSHWMWFVFPQLRGLGHSPTADYYGISSRAEAVAYLAHHVLGPRLHECARLVSDIDGATAEEIFGWPDCLKLHSSMTLFAAVSDDDADFVRVLDRLYDGNTDQRTLDLLSSAR